VVINLQNFGIDQSYIQRYIASKSDKEARKSIWLGGLLYVPVSALFFFIGTQLFAYYQTHPDYLAEAKQISAKKVLMQQKIAPGDSGYEELLNEKTTELTPAQVGDGVFPHFIGRMLPQGIRGLLIAAIFAAGMSTVSTSLNSSATLLMTDWYKRYFRRNAAERESMIALSSSTIVWGILGTGVALLMVRATENILDVWWTLSGILGGGMLGLFLLGLISRKANNPVAIVSVLGGLFVIVWITVSVKSDWLAGRMQWNVDELLINVFGTAAILFTGLLLSLLLSKPKTHR